MLQKVLSEKISHWQHEIAALLKENGESKISDVSINQAYGGMRGVKGLICETSAVSADKGLIIRGHPLLDITHILPEEVFYYYLLVICQIKLPKKISKINLELIKMCPNMSGESFRHYLITLIQ